MEQKIVKYSVLSPLAKVPAYATVGAAAADLCAALEEPLIIAPMQRVLVPTGLAIELPDAGCVALVYARSGLSIKHGLCMANGVGVVDSDYRGELKVPMINLGTEPYTIAPGERVAQLCIAPVWQAAFVPAATLNETERVLAVPRSMPISQVNILRRASSSCKIGFAIFISPSCVCAGGPHKECARHAAAARPLRHCRYSAPAWRSTCARRCTGRPIIL